MKAKRTRVQRIPCYVRGKFKPCPCCESESLATSYNEDDFVIICSDCGLEMGWKKKEEVIEAWNRRPEPAKTPTEDNVEEKAEIPSGQANCDICMSVNHVSKPLTLEKLIEMDGEEVHIDESDFWNGGTGKVCIEYNGVFDPNDRDGYWPFEYYGEWLAYPYKHEVGVTP